MTTTTSTGTLRKSILQLCMLKQQSRIDDFRSRIQSLLEPDPEGLSSPLFRAMHGKKRGEKFRFKGTTYKIAGIS